MAGSSNSFYGHRAILARYAGLRRERPILGYLQHGWHHGWCPWHEGESFYVNLPTAIPKIMWSEVDVAAVERAGGHPVWAVGAPFLYLLRMRGYGGPPGDGSLLCFPHHSSEVGRHDTKWEEYAEFISERAGGRRVTVCLHPLDFADRLVVQTLRGCGVEPVSNGDRTDPRFLYRLADLVEGHDEVTGNRLGTALAFGAAMKRRIWIGGPTPGMVVNTANRPIEREAQLMEDFQREHYPQLLGTGLAPEQAERFAWEELGAGSMLEPEELARALGWRGANRVKARTIASVAALRRWTTGGRGQS